MTVAHLVALWLGLLLLSLAVGCLFTFLAGPSGNPLVVLLALISVTLGALLIAVSRPVRSTR